MISLLHGEDFVASRKDLWRIKSEFTGEVVEIDGKTATKEQLVVVLGTPSLFGEKRLVVIENFLASKDIGKETFDKDSHWDLVLWEGKKLTVSQVADWQKRLASVRVLEFKVDPAIFKFVEAVRPGNGKQAISLLRECLRSEAIEVVYVMLVRQIRLLLLTGSKAKIGPEDFQKLSPWQRARLSTQAARFSQDQLQRFYKQLLEIDFQIKSGQEVADLATSIELLLLCL